MPPFKKPSIRGLRAPPSCCRRHNSHLPCPLAAGRRPQSSPRWWPGLNEDLLAAGQPPVGFLNPLLYHMAHVSPAAFNKARPRTLPYAAFMSEDYSARSQASGFFGAASEGSNTPAATDSAAHRRAGEGNRGRYLRVLDIDIDIKV